MNVETARKLLHGRGIRIASDDSLLTFVLLNDVVLKGVLNPLFSADVNEIQAILRGKGIRISNDDPIFVLLTLNGIVLFDAIDQICRAQARTALKARTSAYLKTLATATLALGTGLFAGIGHSEPSRLVSVFGGLVFGIALGVLGMALIRGETK